MTVLMMLLIIEYGGGFTDEVDGGRGLFSFEDESADRLDGC